MRAPIGNTDLIERLLSPTMKLALAEVCAALEVPRRRWQRVDALNRLFTTLAVIELAASLRSAQKLSKRAALTEAACMIGIPPDTALGWARASRREARKFGVNNSPRHSSNAVVELRGSTVATVQTHGTTQ